MEILLLIYLFIFGLMFGSFSSVIISRLKNGKSGIASWRSECPKCHHVLWAKDLVPLFSFLSTFGKCRYCKTKIPHFYPILEICFWALFVVTGLLFSDLSLILEWNLKEIIKLIFFLLFWFGTLIYVIYDILYFEIPESVLAWLIGLTFLWLLWQNFGLIELFPTLQNTISLTLWQHFTLIISFLVSLFGYYAIMLAGLSYKADWWILAMLSLLWAWIYWSGIDIFATLFGSVFIWTLIAFLFLFVQIFVSNGRVMWGGDLRIAILMGMVLWISYTFFWIMATYILWSCIGIFVLIYVKTRKYYQRKKQTLDQVRKLLGMREKKVEIDTHIPFWPFLAFGMYAALLYWEQIKSLFEIHL